MRKYIATLIVVALATFHAQAADLESQLPGYWQPDMEKTLALAKKANREIDVHEVLDRLEAEFPMDAQLVKLRFFSGLGNSDIAFGGSEPLGCHSRPLLAKDPTGPSFSRPH